MPSMFRDKKGKYRVQWVHDGRRKSRSFDTPKEAKLFEMKLEMGEIDIAQASSPMLKDFAKVWMRDYCQVEKAESQWREDQAVLDQHILPALGGKRLIELRKADLISLKAELSRKEFQANEGWLNKIHYFDTAAGQVTVPIPGYVSMIREVRYKHGDVWVPMTYDDGTDQASYGDLGDRSTQYPIIYRIVDNKFYFDPPLADGGERYLQVESTDYPPWLLDDMDKIEPQFGRACMHFMKYKTASILAASLEKPFIPWAQQEAQWFEKMLITVNKRINKPIRIREFGD